MTEEARSARARPLQRTRDHDDGKWHRDHGMSSHVQAFRNAIKTTGMFKSVNRQ